MPLQRHMPKRGFYNPFSKEIIAISISQLNRFENGDVVTQKHCLLRG